MRTLISSVEMRLSALTMASAEPCTSAFTISGNSLRPAVLSCDIICSSVAPGAAFSKLISRACLLVPIGSAAAGGSIGKSMSTFARLRRADFAIGAVTGAVAFTGFTGTAIFFVDRIFVAVAFEPVAFDFIELLLVSTATFAAVHQ